jgi:hypothetical protein
MILTTVCQEEAQERVFTRLSQTSLDDFKPIRRHRIRHKMRVEEVEIP